MGSWINQLSSFNTTRINATSASTIALTTVNIALAVDDLFIIWRSSGGGLVNKAHNAPSWSGTSYGTWAQIGSSVLNGTNTLSVWYCFITTAMPVGTIVNLPQASSSNIQSYSASAFRNASKTSTFTTPVGYSGVCTGVNPYYTATMPTGGSLYAAPNSVICSALIQNQANTAVWTTSSLGHAIGGSNDFQKQLTGMNLSVYPTVVAADQIITQIYQEISDKSSDTITGSNTIYTTVNQPTFLGFVFAIRPAAYQQGNFLSILT